MKSIVYSVSYPKIHFPIVGLGNCCVISKIVWPTRRNIYHQILFKRREEACQGDQSRLSQTPRVHAILGRWPTITQNKYLVKYSILPFEESRISATSLDYVITTKNPNF